MHKHMMLLATMLLATASTQSASAQTTAPPTAFANVEWGAIHLVRGQVVVLNISLSDKSGPLNLPGQIELEDKNGNVVYRAAFTIAGGHTISVVIAPEVRGIIGPDIRQLVGADIFAIIGPDVRTIQPCIKIGYPPGLSMPVADLLNPTLEVMDLVTGRVESFANNPHITVVGQPE